MTCILTSIFIVLIKIHRDGFWKGDGIIVVVYQLMTVL